MHIVDINDVDFLDKIVKRALQLHKECAEHSNMKNNFIATLLIASITGVVSKGFEIDDLLVGYDSNRLYDLVHCDETDTQVIKRFMVIISRVFTDRVIALTLMQAIIDITLSDEDINTGEDVNIIIDYNYAWITAVDDKFKDLVPGSKAALKFSNN